MNILFFGNRNYWDIEKTGHTRYEQIFKSLKKLNKHQIYYTRIFPLKSFIKHIQHYVHNISAIRIRFSHNSLIVGQMISEKLCIVSIYTNKDEKILNKIIPSIEKQTSIMDEDKWIWFNNPLIWHQIQNVDGYKYYFDTVELYFSVVEYKHFKDSITKIYEDIVGNVQLLTTISEVGVKYFKDMNPGLSAHLIRNGVDLDVFKPANLKRETDNEKTVGLIGNLNSNHEYSGLLNAVRELKNIRFVIIGKVHGGTSSLDIDTKKKLDALFVQSNVTYYEWIPVDELPSLISTFDVGLITYKTKKHDPGNLLNTGDSLKKYQYLACNVPVISSDCQEFDPDLEDGIFTYYEENELKTLIEKVVYMGKRPNYRTLVSNHDWNQIIKRILDCVEQV